MTRFFMWVGTRTWLPALIHEWAIRRVVKRLLRDDPDLLR